MKIILGENSMRTLKKVRHTNELNTTLSSLPLSAKRLLFLALSQVNSRNEINLEDTIFVSASEFAKITGTDINNSYRSLKEGADILSKVALRLEKEEIKKIQDAMGLSGKTPNYMLLNMMEYCVYFPDESRVGIRFTQTSSHYISSIIGSERKFTTQALISVVMLPTTHSTTLYQLIRKMIGLSIHHYGKSFSISLEELKKEMGLIDDNGNTTWAEYPIFKRDVLNKAVKEINNKTEIYNLSFEVSGKIGRKVSNLRFMYEINEDRFKSSLNNKDDEFLYEFDKLFPSEEN